MGYANLRSGRCSVDGQVYLVTFHTAGRRPHFLDVAMAFEASRVMTSALTWPKSRLVAWVLMPDHWHGLIELHDEPLGLCVARLKALSTKALRQVFSSRMAVWAPGFHDRALRRSEHIESAARYLLMNPVRAGLVTKAGNYAFWNASWLDEAHG